MFRKFINICLVSSFCFQSLSVLAGAKKQYPINEVFESYNKMPNLGIYKNQSEYFKLRFLTPISGYRLALKNKENYMFAKHKHSKKEKFSLNYDDLSELKFWSYDKPVITVMVAPQPQTTNMTKVGRFFGYIAAGLFTVATLGIGMATLSLPGKIKGFKVSKDARDAVLVNAKTKEIVCKPKNKDIRVMDNKAQQYFFPDDHYRYFVDRLYVSLFEFEPNCFATGQKLKLQLFDGKENKKFSYTIPKKLQRVAEQDFSFYGYSYDAHVMSPKF